MEIFRPKKETGPETRRSPDRAGEGDRRRGTWSDFRRAYPGFVFVLGLGLVAMLAVDAWLIAKRVKYNHDVSQLRAHMTDAERQQIAKLLRHIDEARLALERQQNPDNREIVRDLRASADQIYDVLNDLEETGE